MGQTILRLPAVKERTGLSRSSIYKAVAGGLWTRPVHLAPRAVGWPSGECDAILAARIAGRPDDEIKRLVIALEAARQDAGVAAA